MDKTKFNKMVKELGTNRYKKGISWKGYEVYEPVYQSNLAIGEPIVILAKGEELRYTTPEESYDYLRFYQQQKGIKGED